MSDKAQGLPMSTIVVVILVVVAISAILVFVFTIAKSGTEQTEQQAGLGAGATVTANCRLWAMAALDFDEFDCQETKCAEETLCDACERHGQYKEGSNAGRWKVDLKNCLLPSGSNFGGCATCPP
jgi:hypothetical protein